MSSKKLIGHRLTFVPEKGLYAGKEIVREFYSSDAAAAQKHCRNGYGQKTDIRNVALLED